MKNLNEEIVILTHNTQSLLSYEKYTELYTTRANIQILNYDKKAFTVIIPIPNPVIDINNIAGIKWNGQDYHITGQVKFLKNLIQFIVQKIEGHNSF